MENSISIEEQWKKFKESDEFKNASEIKQHEYFISFCMRKMMRDMDKPISSHDLDKSP